MYRLWVNGTSPYARLCRVVALEKGVPVELQWTDPWREPADLLAVSPSGKIPALETPDGAAVVESGVICDLLDRVGGGPSLAPVDAASLARLGLARALTDNAFGAAIQKRFFPQGENLLAERWRRGLLRGLAALAETALSPPTPDRTPDLADLTLGVALRYLELRYGDVAIPPTLALFDREINQRESFQATAWTTA